MEFLILFKIVYGEINAVYLSWRTVKIHLTTAASQKTWRIAGRQKPIIRSLRSAPLKGKPALLVNTVESVQESCQFCCRVNWCYTFPVFWLPTSNPFYYSSFAVYLLAGGVENCRLRRYLIGKFENWAGVFNSLSARVACSSPLLSPEILQVF